MLKSKMHVNTAMVPFTCWGQISGVCYIICTTEPDGVPFNVLSFHTGKLYWVSYNGMIT